MDFTHTWGVWAHAPEKRFFGDISKTALQNRPKLSGWLGNGGREFQKIFRDTPSTDGGARGGPKIDILTQNEPNGAKIMIFGGFSSIR